MTQQLKLSHLSSRSKERGRGEEDASMVVSQLQILQIPQAKFELKSFVSLKMKY